MKRNGFITYEERTAIEKGLNDKQSFSFIARLLGRSISTISREVKRNSIVYQKSTGVRYFNNCANRRECKYRMSRSGKFSCTDGIRKNTLSNEPCKDFVEIVCEKRFEYPYVCNGCKEFFKCLITKTMYFAKEADEKSKERISESRKGIALSPEQLEELNQIINELISTNNQSPAAAAYNNQDMINVSIKTIYNYINAGILSTRNIDLPYKVRYRPRKDTYTKKVESKCRESRTYDDFNNFLNNNPRVNIVEMDTVEGVKGGKCILTLYFRDCGLQLAFLRDHNNSRSVTDIFNELYKSLKHDDFTELFEVILTDNGTEFSNPTAIENHIELSKKDNPSKEEKRIPRSRLFYCDAGNPTQKPGCERNHKFIRRFIPKGSTFNKYNQDDIDLMMNHINSYKRKKINHQSPAEKFILIHGKTIAEKLGIKVIPSNKVNLSSTVFK